MNRPFTPLSVEAAVRLSQLVRGDTELERHAFEMRMRAMPSSTVFRRVIKDRWEIGPQGYTTLVPSDLRGLMALHAAIAAAGGYVDVTAFVRPGAKQLRNSMVAQLSTAAAFLERQCPRLALACEQVRVRRNGLMWYSGPLDIDTGQAMAS